MQIPVIPAEVLSHLTESHRHFYARAAAGWNALCQLIGKTNPREVVREVLLFLGGATDAPLPPESMLQLEVWWCGQKVLAEYPRIHIMAALHYGAGVPWSMRKNGQFLPAAEWTWATWDQFCAHWPDDAPWPAWSSVVRHPPVERLIGEVPPPRQPRQTAPPEMVVE